jgi:hypothetical protein
VLDRRLFIKGIVGSIGAVLAAKGTTEAAEGNIDFQYRQWTEGDVFDGGIKWTHEHTDGFLVDCTLFEGASVEDGDFSIMYEAYTKDFAFSRMETANDFFTEENSIFAKFEDAFREYTQRGYLLPTQYVDEYGSLYKVQELAHVKDSHEFLWSVYPYVEREGAAFAPIYVHEELTALEQHSTGVTLDQWLQEKTTKNFKHLEDVVRVGKEPFLRPYEKGLNVNAWFA